jgi:hypothetical protein
MFYFLRRGVGVVTCESRLDPDGPGYELVVTLEDRRVHIERFTEIAALLAREHQLLQAWRAQGWAVQGHAPAKTGGA